MSVEVAALVAAAVFGWGMMSGRLERADLTAPIAFVGVGLVLNAVTSIDHPLDVASSKLLTEATLALVLFSDAARVGVRELRSDAAVYGRLLGLALPLTVVGGWLLAWGLVPRLDLWLALLVGAALAPTDAALGAAVIVNRAVPARIRRIINVESGLNDGIVTPVVLLALAGAATAEGGHGAPHAAVQLLLGAAVGVAVGAAGGAALRAARRHRWVDEQFAGPAVLALTLLAYTGAVASGGNGFVAAFAAGIAFGDTAGDVGPTVVFYVEESAALASLLVWTLFGAVAVPVVSGRLGWQLVVYAVLALTVVRMVPVGLVLLGTGLDRRTRWFVGWFGPRGLASVVFALLAVEELGPRADTAVALIVTTVLLSVLAHGFTAAPLSARYGRLAAAGPVRSVGVGGVADRAAHDALDPAGAPAGGVHDPEVALLGRDLRVRRRYGNAAAVQQRGSERDPGSLGQPSTDPAVAERPHEGLAHPVDRAGARDHRHIET